MSFPIDGKPYSHDELIAHINSLDFSAWKHKDGSPGKLKFVVVHNTSNPTKRLWLSWTPEKRQQYILNMQGYYGGMGWAGGPHYFVTPTVDPVAFGFNRPLVDGTHASCFNTGSLGIETVGEFDVEDFDAVTQGNLVLLLAMIHIKAGLTPAPYLYGQHGLHFHVECKADDHDCPGRNVHKPDLVAAVQAKMIELGAAPPAPPIAAPAPAVVNLWDVVHDNIYCTEFSGTGDRETSAYSGAVIDPSVPAFSLPALVPAGLRRIAATYNGITVEGDIVDKGPWNTRDDAYVRDGSRPLAEAQHANRTHAQNGQVPSSPAGLDATPAVLDAWKVPGREGTRSVGEWSGGAVRNGVTWKFVEPTTS